MSPFSLIMLFFVLVACIWGLVSNLREVRKKRVHLRRAHREWMEMANRFAEWRSLNRFSNHETPHYQWLVREELRLFDSYVFAYMDLNSESTPKQKEYRRSLVSREVPSIEPQMPPDINESNDKRR
jgi:hypothetical protein